MVLKVYKVVIVILHDKNQQWIPKKQSCTRKQSINLTRQIWRRCKFQQRLDWQSIEVMPTRHTVSHYGGQQDGPDNSDNNQLKTSTAMWKKCGQHKLLRHRQVKHIPHNWHKNHAQEVCNSQEWRQSEARLNTCWQVRMYQTVL